jgi:hypothetical protein
MTSTTQHDNDLALASTRRFAHYAKINTILTGVYGLKKNC